MNENNDTDYLAGPVPASGEEEMVEYGAPKLGTALLSAAFLYSALAWVKPVSMFWSLSFLAIGFFLAAYTFSTDR